MESYNMVWGLDIGTTAVKAVKLQRVADKVFVHGYAIEPIVVNDEADRDEAVLTALRNLCAREDMRATPVVACLSGRQIFSRTINVPVLNPRKIERMVELEARQQIPGDFNEVLWGYHLSPGADGASNDVALFAARQEVVTDLTSKCKRVGITLAGISVSSLAVYNFVQYDQGFGPDETIIVIDAGAENTDLVIYRGDSLWMRNLGISGSDITRSFMKKFRVSFEEAESLKTQVADSRQAERILKVIEASLVELVADVQRSLGFYKNQNPDATFENVVVSGGTFKLPTMAQFMADRLGMAIITLIELEHIEIAPDLEREHFLEDLQSLGVAMGLGLQGLGVAHAKVDLMPSHLRLQSLLRTKRWAAICILCILPVAFAISYLIEKSHLEQSVRVMARIDERVERNRQDQDRLVGKPQEIIDSLREVQAFAGHARHAGFYAEIESLIMRVVQDFAHNQSYIVATRRGSPETGMSPFAQPLYLDALSISDFRLEDGRSAFAQFDVPRRLELRVRVGSQRVANELERQLRSLRMTETMWQVRHPGEPLPDELPLLFSDLSVTGSPTDTQETWVYRDPHHYDAEGNLAPIQEERQIRVRTWTFAGTFGGPGAWGGGHGGQR